MIHQNHVFRVRLHSNSLDPFFVSHYANEMGRRFFIEGGASQKWAHPQRVMTLPMIS